MILSIQYLRGLAALFVVLFHYRDYINNVYAQRNLGEILFGPGVSGVDLFFFISGIIIFISTSKMESRHCVKFVVRRFFRIYPLLFLSIILFYFVSPEQISLTDIIKSSMPIHLNYGMEGPYFGYNIYVPAWTITYEIFFYFIFLLSMLSSFKYRGYICIIFISILFLTTRLHFNGEIDLDPHHNVNFLGRSLSEFFIQMSGSPMMIEFVIGVILGMAYEKYDPKSSDIQRKISIGLLWFGMGIFLTFWFSWLLFGHGPLKFGVWFLFLVPALLIYEKNNKIKKIPLLNFLSEISFSLYMTHIVLVYFLGIYNAYVPLYGSLSGIAKLIYVTTLSISFAYIIHISIEKPVLRLSRIIISRIN